ncbi:hypothetical protein N0V88_007887 [Collariella sp. IMI 366227]|nr:hypothetical protein N0V88_007887 [Collariella sp. IMI 366227]
MRYLYNLTTCITVEAATLIGLTFVATTSYIYRSVMARKKKSGASKPPYPQSTGLTPSTPKAVAQPKGAQAKPVPVAPVVQEVDNRPENSPYGSPACTIPFASPLTVPLDILKKSPKLQAAYESRLPELPSIPQDVGHVLVHYLHTGTYESLRPKFTDTMSKQICELRTSIQAYAAARVYDLPDLMRLAEAKIDKHGEGLPLPALLEVARDAYPTLTEGDAWFLDYLRSKIRPHLKDPKFLLGSDLLDQISGILSPHKVLLRTVLELFCERIVVRSEPTMSPNLSTITSPITSPGSSRPVSPLPPASPLSLLEMRSRSMRDDFQFARKTLKATPWPSPDNLSEASWSRETSPEPVMRELSSPRFEVKPVPALVQMPMLTPFVDLGPVILDISPPPGPSFKPVEAPEVEALPEPEPVVVCEPENIDVEPEDRDAYETEAKVMTQPKLAPIPELEAEELDMKPAVEAEFKVQLKPELEINVGTTQNAETQPETKAPELEDKIPAQPEINPAVEPETTGSGEAELGEKPVQNPLPAPQRERKDSGKGIDLHPFSKELASAPEPMPELETESKPQPQPLVQWRVPREADSGFWEDPNLEPGKEPAPSVVELEEPVVFQVPLPVPAPLSVHELHVESEPESKVPAIAIRDFAEVETDLKETEQAYTEKQADAEEAKETFTVSLPAQDSVSGMSTEIPPKVDLEVEPKPEPLPTKSVEDKTASATTLVPEITSVEIPPEKVQDKEVETQPDTEKVEPFLRGREQETLLTMHQAQEKAIEPEAVAEPEPQPKANPSDPVHLPNDAQPARAPESKTAQPGVEPGPKPAGKTKIQIDRVKNTPIHTPTTSRTSLVKSKTVLSTKPAPEHQEGTKTEADTTTHPVRQKSVWKKRFLSLRYPVLFGRGM